MAGDHPPQKLSSRLPSNQTRQNSTREYQVHGVRKVKINRLADQEGDEIPYKNI